MLPRPLPERSKVSTRQTAPAMQTRSEVWGGLGTISGKTGLERRKEWFGVCGCSLRTSLGTPRRVSSHRYQKRKAASSGSRCVAIGNQNMDGALLGLPQLLLSCMDAARDLVTVHLVSVKSRKTSVRCKKRCSLLNYGSLARARVISHNFRQWKRDSISCVLAGKRIPTT